MHYKYRTQVSRSSLKLKLNKFLRIGPGSLQLVAAVLGTTNFAMSVAAVFGVANG